MDAAGAVSSRQWAVGRKKKAPQQRIYDPNRAYKEYVTRTVIIDVAQRQFPTRDW
jgi:hypothetical protein